MDCMNNPVCAAVLHYSWRHLPNNLPLLIVSQIFTTLIDNESIGGCCYIEGGGASEGYAIRSWNRWIILLLYLELIEILLR